MIGRLHPQRGQLVGWIGEDVVDAAGDLANACVDVIHLIPGMDWAGDQLKDFAKTGFGEWCLRVVATYGYYVTAPYLGAQLAAVSFALPGVAKAEPFVESWIKETIDRVIKTINILLKMFGTQIPQLGAATSEAFNKWLAENPQIQSFVQDMTAQGQAAFGVLRDKLGAELCKQIKDGIAGALESAQQKLLAEYGMPPDFRKLAREAGIREDNAASAYDLLMRTHYQTITEWDPISGEDIAARNYRERFLSVTTQGDSLSGTGAYADPRMGGVSRVILNPAPLVADLSYWVKLYNRQAAYARTSAAASRLITVAPLSAGILDGANTFTRRVGS